MNKFFLSFAFFISLLSFASASHPLHNPGENVKIESVDINPDFYFLPIKELQNESTLGICIIVFDEETRVGHFYVSVKKANNISEVYIIDSDDLSAKTIKLILEVKQEYVNRVRVRWTGRADRYYAPFKHSKMTDELNAQTSSLLEDYNQNSLFAMAEDIISTYANEGKSGVRKKYGKTIYEINNEREEEEAREERIRKQREQEKSKNIHIDKNGCIAHVNDDNLIKVVAKKAAFNGNHFDWSVKIKNISRFTIESCYVTIKCLDKDGFQISDGIESSRNIAPGEERIISGTTDSCSGRDAKKVKTKQFEISAYK